MQQPSITIKPMSAASTNATTTPAYFWPCAALVVAFHFFGVLGTHNPWMIHWLQQLTPYESFMDLTPLNLLVTAAILLYFHPQFSGWLVLFGLLCLSIGFWIEVTGVATGVVFGEYWYGEVLGVKMLNVPIIIGVNWLVLAYASCIVVNALPIVSDLAKSLIAAAVMVSLDVLIEPVAIHFGMWTWATPEVPLQNYVAWYAVSLVMTYAFFHLPIKRPNPMAWVVLICQFTFFAAQNWLI